MANQARERIHELVADYEATRASFFPRLALTSYYQRLDQDRMPPGGFTPPEQRLFDQESLTTVSAKQTIFKGGRTYYGAQAATLGTEAQREESTRTTDEIAYTVTLAFFRLLESKENLRVATEALQQRQAFAAVTEAFFRAGNVTRLDYLRARSLVADAEQAEMEAGNAITQGRVILATAMGLRDEALADDLDVRGELPQDPTPGPDLSSLWQAVLRGSPEIKKLDLTLAQSQALIQAARGGYFPEVSVQGAVGLRHQDIAGTKGEWLIGAFLDFPFFEGGVARLGSAADTVTRELEIDVKFSTLPNPLVIGEESEVTIETGRVVALAIPWSAIQVRNGTQGVLVIAEARARFRPIVTGAHDDHRAAVVKGLQEGEIVALNPADIAPGKKVWPQLDAQAVRKAD